VNYSSDREGAERVAQGIADNGGEAIAGPTCPRPQMSRGYSKKWILRSEDWTFWSTTPGYSASAPSRRSPRRAFTSTTTSTFSGRFSPCRWRSSGSGADGGSIINLSSIVGSHPVAGALLYASTKGAIETLTRGLALELAPRKIRVNAIAPGHTETEGNVAAGTFEGGAGAVLAGKTPLGRLGRVSDIAPLAVFLASDESAWITGEVIRAAGGLVVAT